MDNYGKLSNVLSKSFTVLPQAKIKDINTGAEPVFTVMATTVRPTAPRISGVSIVNSPFNPLDGESTTINYSVSAEALVPTLKTTFRSTTIVEKEAPRITGVMVQPNPFKTRSSSMNIRYTLSEIVPSLRKYAGTVL